MPPTPDFVCSISRGWSAETGRKRAVSGCVEFSYLWSARAPESFGRISKVSGPNGGVGGPRIERAGERESDGARVANPFG